jgi:AcrR family transcriptional regulator
VDQRTINNGNRRERKKGETRQQIINTAMHMFREQGFQTTSMEQIANKVDISKVTIYNYFPVKEAIVSEYMQSGNRRIREEKIPQLIEDFPDTRSRLLELFRMSHEWMKENREIYKVYFGYRMQNLFESFRDQSKRSGFEGVLAMIIGVGREDGEIRRDMSEEFLARHFEMMSAAAFMPWWADPDTFSLEENLGPTIDLFLNGASPREQ